MPNNAAAPPPGGALHENLHRSDEIVGPSERNFGLTIGAVCGAIGAIRLLLGREHWIWWFVAALALVGFAAVWPAALRPLNRAWLWFGLILHKIVNPIVMALLYYSTIVPIGFLMQLCGKDPLRRRREPEARSYWIAREPPGPPPDTMQNQF